MMTKNLHVVGDYVVRVGTLQCECQGVVYPNTYEVINTATGITEYAHPQLISALTAAELFAFQLERKLYKADNVVDAPDLPGFPFAMMEDAGKPN